MYYVIENAPAIQALLLGVGGLLSGSALLLFAIRSTGR